MAVQHVDDLPARQGGGKCGDVWADELIGAMSTGGAVDFVDGVEFDVPFKQPQFNGRSRSADCNADGIPDNGVVAGVPVFAIGYDAFLKRLRLGLPDKLIMADAGEEKHQRSLRWLNGIEIEGWPNLSEGGSPRHPTGRPVE